MRSSLAHPDQRVIGIPLDITRPEQIQKAATRVGPIDVLVNNAGHLTYDNLTEPAALDEHLAVNLAGTLRLTQALLPGLTQTHGAIVNILTIAAIAPVPLMLPSYSISKAALLSATQVLRAYLASSGVAVHAVLPGPVDTAMTTGLQIPKASPESVAREVLDGVEEGTEDIFPDPVSRTLAEGWASGVTKALELENAQFLPTAS